MAQLYVMSQQYKLAVDRMIEQGGFKVPPLSAVDMPAPLTPEPETPLPPCIVFEIPNTGIDAADYSVDPPKPSVTECLIFENYLSAANPAGVLKDTERKREIYSFLPYPLKYDSSQSSYGLGYQDANGTWWVANLPRVFVPVRMTLSGGFEGDETTKCTFEYTLEDPDDSSIVYATNYDPVNSPGGRCARSPVGKYVGATFGIGIAGLGNEFQMYNCNEVLFTEACSTPIVGVGEMELTAPSAGADIGLAYQPVDQFDSVSIPGQGITLATDGTFTFQQNGIWDIRLQLNISHNESNASRETNIRLYDVTGAAEIGSAAIPIARNQPGTATSISLRANIPSSGLGNTYRFEIGGGDTLSAVLWNVLNLAPTLIPNTSTN